MPTAFSFDGRSISAGLKDPDLSGPDVLDRGGVVLTAGVFQPASKFGPARPKPEGNTRCGCFDGRSISAGLKVNRRTGMKKIWVLTAGVFQPASKRLTYGSVLGQIVLTAGVFQPASKVPPDKLLRKANFPRADPLASGMIVAQSDIQIEMTHI